jgi:hypothetical protein
LDDAGIPIPEPPFYTRMIGASVLLVALLVTGVVVHTHAAPAVAIRSRW